MSRASLIGLSLAMLVVLAALEQSRVRPDKATTTDDLLNVLNEIQQEIDSMLQSVSDNKDAIKPQDESINVDTEYEKLKANIQRKRRKINIAADRRFNNPYYQYNYTLNSVVMATLEPRPEENKGRGENDCWYHRRWYNQRHSPSTCYKPIFEENRHAWTAFWGEIAGDFTYTFDFVLYNDLLRERKENQFWYLILYLKTHVSYYNDPSYLARRSVDLKKFEEGHRNLEIYKGVFFTVELLLDAVKQYIPSPAPPDSMNINLTIGQPSKSEQFKILSTG